LKRITTTRNARSVMINCTEEKVAARSVMVVDILNALK